jgi:hypothetical protein
MHVKRGGQYPLILVTTAISAAEDSDQLNSLQIINDTDYADH